MRYTTLDRHYMNMPAENLEYETGEMFSYFDKANQHYYNNELKRPVITLESKGRRKMELGWVTDNPEWKVPSDNNPKYALNICPESFSGPLSAVIEILLHQMVHLYCKQHDIIDVTNDGHYHNKKFREIALSHGLLVNKSGSNGWSEVSLTDEAYNYFNCERTHQFRIYRSTKENLVPKRTGGAKYKYTCPVCHQSVRGNKKTNVICGICKCQMEQEKSLADFFDDNSVEQPTDTEKHLLNVSKLFEEI